MITDDGYGVGLGADDLTSAVNEFKNIVQQVKNATGSGPTSLPAGAYVPTQSASAGIPPLILYGGLALLVYFALKSKR